MANLSDATDGVLRLEYPVLIFSQKLLTMKNPAFVLACLVSFLYACNLSGQAGTLDPTFGVLGTVITDFDGGTATVSHVSSLPDGKVRMGGYYAYKSEFRFLLFQYHPDGSPDSSFGSVGRIYADVNHTVEYRALPDGKFRLYGFINDSDSAEFVIQQFMPDGNPDLSFGPEGKFFPEHAWFGISYPIERFFIQSDLKIVLVLQGDDLLIARLLPDGQPDLSFGNLGIIITDLGHQEACTTVYEQEDGKLLAAGRSGTFNWWTFVGSSLIIRYQPDGSLDTAFGENGIVLGNMDSIQYNILAVQQDQKILALLNSPSSVNGFIDPLVMTRLTPDGNLDSSFATNGHLFLPALMALQLRVIPNGNILLFGSKLVGSDPFGYALYGLPLVYRYTPEGQPDPGFGYNGYDPAKIAVHDMVLLPDDTLLLCGSYDGDAMLLRYLPDGQIDNAFGENGLLPLHFGKNGSCLLASYMPNAGLLVAGTKSEIAYDSDIVLAKTRSDGSPDAGFGPAGTPGKVVLDFGMDNYVSAHAMAIQSNGNISVAGSIDKDLVLFQFKPDGTPDQGFSENGYAIIHRPIEFKEQTVKTLYQAEGKILRAGIVEDTGSSKIMLQRLNADGSIDEQFDQLVLGNADFQNHEIQRFSSLGINQEGEIFLAGTIASPIDPNTWTEVPYIVKALQNGELDQAFGTNGIALLSDNKDISEHPTLSLFKNGRILVSAEINSRLHHIKLLPDGNPDLDFGSEGKIINEFATADLTPASILILEDNAFIVGGIGYKNGLFFFCSKYQENGTPDSTFGDEGKVTLPVPTDYFFFFTYGSTDALLQPDGKILFAGSIFSNNNSDFGLIRLEKNGTFDQSFGNNGFVQTDLGGDERVIQFALQNDNKILVAGTKTYDGFSSIALVRYLNDLNLGIINLQSSIEEALIYPNPIGDHATLEYELTREDQISIQVVDMQGRVIKTLVNHRHMNVGKHQETLDLSSIHIPGFFILQLRGEKGSLNVKMIKS